MSPLARLRRPSLPALAALSVLGVTLAVYAGTLSHGFVQWDDPLTIYRNPDLGDLDLGRVVWAFTDVATTMRFVPLTLLSLSLTHTIHGLDPFGYHLANWLLHGAAAVLLFLLLQELLRVTARRRTLEPGGPWVVVAAAVGALAWSLHPLRVEVVAWSNSRGHAQATLFAFLSLLVYLRAHREGAPSPHPWRASALSVAAFLAALLSHPIAIGVAPVFVLLDVHLGRLGGQAGWWTPAARRVLLEKVPFAAAAAATLSVTVLVRVLRPGIWSPPVSLADWGLFPRAMQATFVWAHYVLVTLWPVGLQPAPTALIDFDPWTATFLVRAALVVATSAALLLLRRRWPWLLLLWLAHLALLVPSLGLTEHPMFACDRYASLPGLVPAVLAGAAVLALGATPVRRLAAAIGAAAVLALLGGLAQAQARTWQSSVTLFEHMLPFFGDHPSRLGILKRLGGAYLDEGRYPSAVAALQQVAAVAPTDPINRSSLGFALWQSGQAGDAVPHYEAAVGLAPARLDLRCQYAAVLAAAGRSEEARRQAEVVLRWAPGARCAQEILTSLDARGRPR